MNRRGPTGTKLLTCAPRVCHDETRGAPLIARLQPRDTGEGIGVQYTRSSSKALGKSPLMACVELQNGRPLFKYLKEGLARARDQCPQWDA